MSKVLDRYFAIVKRCIPEQENKPLVGLDIGLHACKMVELKKRGSSYEMLSWAVVPVVQGNQKQAIKDVLTKLTTPTVAPATAVFGKGCLIRFIEMPRMNPEDLRKSFAYEADKYFPFPSDQVYLDFYILDAALKDNKMSVLVAAVKKNLIDDRLKLLTDAGLQAHCISLNAVAVANAYSVLGVPEDRGGAVSDKDCRAVAILDMGERVSGVTILVDGIPRFTRDIFIGGRDLTKGISTALQIDFAEAEKLKCAPGERAEEFLQICDSTILDLVNDLRLSFDYFVNDRNVPISKLLLTGGASMMTGLSEALAKYLEIEVKRWNALERLTLRSDLSGEQVNSDAEKLSVALGLALCE